MAGGYNPWVSNSDAFDSSPGEMAAHRRRLARWKKFDGLHLPANARERATRWEWLLWVREEVRARGLDEGEAPDDPERLARHRRIREGLRHVPE